MAIHTIGYLCYLCDDKNQLVKNKNALLQEAKNWKSDKHLGRADVCFEEYEALKHVATSKTAHIKEVSKSLKARLVYAEDYSVIGIEVKAPGVRYETVADSHAKIKELAEQYIVESIILGNFDDKP